MKSCLRFLLFVYLVIWPGNAGLIFSQSTDSTYLNNEQIFTQVPPELSYKILGVSFISGYMIPHAKEVLNVRGTNPRGYEANIFWHMYNNDVWNDCNCYPRIGAFISFYDFDLEGVLGYVWLAG